jgi:hypothetical protein
MRLPVSALLAAVLVLAAVSRADGQGAGEYAAVAAARSRQEAIKTANVEYKLTEVLAPGSLAWDTSGRTLPKGPIPEKEMTVESINRLVLDGVKVRYEENHPSVRQYHAVLVERHSIHVFDGSLVKNLWPRGLSGEADHPLGQINADPHLSGLKFHVMDPFTIAVRSFHPLHRPSPFNGMKPSGESLMIDGAPCEEWVHTDSEGNSVTFWLNPAQDYVVRRIGHQSKHTLTDQTEIHYRRESVAWIPDSWVRTEYRSDGSVRVTTKVDVLEVRLNDPQPGELFDVAFPPGTDISDNRDNKYFQVQPDGSFSEVGPNGQALPQPAAPPAAPWYQRYAASLIGLGLVLMGLLLAYLFRRKRLMPFSRRHPSGAGSP